MWGQVTYAYQLLNSLSKQSLTFDFTFTMYEGCVSAIRLCYHQHFVSPFNYFYFLKLYFSLTSFPPSKPSDVLPVQIHGLFFL